MMPPLHHGWFGRPEKACRLKPAGQVHPNYYGAVILDPDGNNIEAVCHEPM
jgi:hypothetical protein